MELQKRVKKILAFCEYYGIPLERLLKVSKISYRDFVRYLDNDPEVTAVINFDKLYQLFDFKYDGD